MTITDSYGLIYTINADSLILGTDNNNNPSNANPSKDCNVNLILPKEVYGYIVRRIGGSAFRLHEKLKSVHVPNTVTSFGWDCFAYNYELHSLTFEAGSQLLSMEGGCFFGCYSLKTIRIPPSMNSILLYTFGATDIDEFYYCGYNFFDNQYIFMLPDGVTSSLPKRLFVPFYYPYNKFGEATNVHHVLSCEFTKFNYCTNVSKICEIYFDFFAYAAVIALESF